MKKSIIMSVLFIGLTAVSFAQIKTGAVTYKMDFASDDPEMAMGISMMAGSTMKLQFAPGKSRSDITMGMMGKMSVISDQKTNKSLSLMDMMGMKYATNIDNEPADAQPKYTVEKTKETKKIAGYTATKAIMRDEEGSEMTGWFTQDIATPSNSQYFNSQMPGFPLEINMKVNGMNVTMLATSVEKKTDKDAFDMKIPEGYEVKAADEMMMDSEGEE